MGRKIEDILRKGGICVMPTDTIYGILGSALKKRAVERIYKVRKRDPKKPFIILISRLSELKKFGIRLSARHLELLKKIWPGPVSVILPCKSKKFSYLHRGTNALAFRLPKNRELLGLLRKTGPLVAPSANIAGKPPARTVKEAWGYFGESVDAYIDKGKIEGKPSVLLEIKR